jgi:alcohol dehydrogenase class IV
MGVPEDAFPGLAETALGDAALFTNPRPATIDDLIDVLHAAW